jgi:hypothetical protein
MAVLRLDSYDRKVVELPGVCMQCGAPSTLLKTKTFSWFPPWVWILLFVCNVLIFAIVAAIMTKRRTVDVPLCEEHKNHWLWRQLLVIGSLLGVLAIGVVAVMVNSDNGGGDNALAGFLCVGSLILLVVWVILAVIVQASSIRPKEITDHGITLTGVSTAFVEAYKEEWHVAPERLDELARERWNQRGHVPRAGRPASEDADRIQPTDEDEGRRAPPDAFQEGTS